MKKIIIRADDLGFSKAINYGIYETVKNGIINNVGLMVNMPDSIHGYKLIEKYNLCIGQHTNICAGKPISDPILIPSLVQKNGYFKTSKTYRNSKEDIVVLEEAIIEVEAQYQRFKKITGKKPDYFEAHALNSSNLDKAIQIVGKRHNLKTVSFPNKNGEVLIGNSLVKVYMESILPQYDPLVTFNKMIKKADKCCQMMIFHPGYMDRYIMEVSSLTLPRLLETDLLTSNDFKNYIKNIKFYRIDEI